MMVFRYDPPVLVVALTWHESPAPFCDTLYQRLIQGYHNNSEDVRSSVSGINPCADYI